MKQVIYQLLPRLWGPYAPGDCGKFSHIDDATFAYLRDLGVTHVWYTGVIRHATRSTAGGFPPSHPQCVKGEAGSPYAVTDWYDVNPYLADDPARRMAEFEDLVRRTHAAGLKVILDFVPNHVAREYGRFGSAAPAGVRPLGADDDTSVHWRAENDFFYYPGERLRLPVPPPAGAAPYEECPAKASGNCYSPAPGVNDWYETVKLNYCDFPTPTWDKMRDILLYWVGKGVDGFRCDMVELVPPAFFRWLIPSVKAVRPDLLFIAEVYQKNLYHRGVHEIGFDLLYDKSGLYDILRAIVEKNIREDGAPVELWQSAQRITGAWQFLGDLQPRMLNFLENHDEQRIASDFFARRPENAYAALGVSLLFNTASFLVYAGQELGERGMEAEAFSGVDGRTSIFDWCRVPALQRLWTGLHSPGGLADPVLGRYRELLRLAVSEPAFATGRTYDLCYCNHASRGFDRDRHFAFLRSDGRQVYIVFANFAARSADVDLRIPSDAFSYLGVPGDEKTVHALTGGMDCSVRVL